jgi:hypothetical protein
MQGTMVINREKTKKIFRFFERSLFFKQLITEIIKVLAIKEVLDKKPHHF